MINGKKMLSFLTLGKKTLRKNKEGKLWFLVGWSESVLALIVH